MQPEAIQETVQKLKKALRWGLLQVTNWTGDDGPGNDMEASGATEKGITSLSEAVGGVVGGGGGLVRGRELVCVGVSVWLVDGRPPPAHLFTWWWEGKES